MIELRSGRAVAQVDVAGGGRLATLRFAGTEILSGTGNAQVPAAMRDGSFVMAPFAGRLPTSTLVYDGTACELEPTLGGLPAHGLVFDRPWTQVDEATIRIGLADLWPFGGQVEQHFELRDSALTVTATLRNDERTMPGALGFHPWFARYNDGAAAELDFRPTLRHRYRDAYDLGTSPDLGVRPWDDCFCSPRGDPALNWPGAQRITVRSAATHWVIYEGDPDAICLEPVTAPPGALATATPPVVTPEQPLVLHMTIEIAPGARHPGECRHEPAGS